MKRVKDKMKKTKRLLLIIYMAFIGMVFSANIWNNVLYYPCQFKQQVFTLMYQTAIAMLIKKDQNV